MTISSTLKRTMFTIMCTETRYTLYYHRNSNLRQLLNCSKPSFKATLLPIIGVNSKFEIVNYVIKSCLKVEFVQPIFYMKSLTFYKP